MVHCKRVHTCLLHVRNADPSLKHKILKWTPYGFCIKDFRLGIKYKIIKSTWYGISVRKVYWGKSSYTTYTWNHCLFFWAWKQKKHQQWLNFWNSGRKKLMLVEKMWKTSKKYPGKSLFAFQIFVNLQL